MRGLVMLAVVFVPMLVEARRAVANERAQLSRGGVEATGDVYRIMRLAYPAAFLAMIAESAVRGGPSPAVAAVGAAVFVLAKSLKWWAIAALGESWTFRVITVRGSARVTTGPYAFFRHPNYIAVVGELMGTALLTGAALTGPGATVAFSLLMLKRIAIEERALHSMISKR